MDLTKKGFDTNNETVLTEPFSECTRAKVGATDRCGLQRLMNTQHIGHHEDECKQLLNRWHFIYVPRYVQHGKVGQD